MEKSEKCSSSSSSSEPRIFEFVRRAFKLSYHIRPEGGQPIYFVRNSLCCGRARNLRSPDLTLRDGPDESAPVFAVCHMPKFSGNHKLGLGNYFSDPESMIWEDLVHTRAWSNERKFSVVLDEDYNVHHEGKGGRRRQFMWKPTRKVHVKGKKMHRCSVKNWKLVDEEGFVVAIFTERCLVGVAGHLQMNGDFGKEFEALIMLSVLSMYERIRRR